MQIGRMRTDDFDAIREALTGWDHVYDQIAPGGFRGGLSISEIDGLQLSRVF